MSDLWAFYLLVCDLSLKNPLWVGKWVGSVFPSTSRCHHMLTYSHTPTSNAPLVNNMLNCAKLSCRKAYMRVHAWKVYEHRLHLYVQQHDNQPLAVPSNRWAVMICSLSGFNYRAKSQTAWSRFVSTYVYDVNKNVTGVCTETHKTFTDLKRWLQNTIYPSQTDWESHVDFTSWGLLTHSLCWCGVKVINIWIVFLMN